MRTQLARVIDLDDASWRLPPVDPTGWLADRPVEGAGSRRTAADPHGDPVSGSAAAHAGVGSTAGLSAGVDGARRRRPRRTVQARIVRERELARRRRRRQRRTLSAVRPAGAMLTVRPAGASLPRRVAADPGEYRIGRWGRLALTMLVLGTLALISVRVVAGLTAAGAPPVDVTVRPGDTLWSIAAAAAPDRDPRAVIDEIRDLNQVTGDLVRAGEVLRVPMSPDRG